MKYPLPLFIDVAPDTLHALLACARRAKGFSAGGAKVQAAVAAIEQLVKDREPADPVIVERAFKHGVVPSLEEICLPGLAQVNVEQVSVLLAYARREIEHIGWCFDARDDEDLERQIPGNSADGCPVCNSAYEIEKHVRHVREWRNALLGNECGVTHHEKHDFDDEETPGQAPA
jgi:hypothetical protein